MTITYGIQSNVVAAMAIEVIHNSCNMCIRNLPDIYDLSPQASSTHIRIYPLCPCYSYVFHVSVWS